MAISESILAADMQTFVAEGSKAASQWAELQCERCARYCCTCARPIEGGPVSRHGHLFCSLACAETRSDCGARSRLQ